MSIYYLLREVRCLEKDSEMLERIDVLEQELRTLRAEVQHLKEHTKFEKVVPAQNKVTSTSTSVPAVKTQPKEQLVIKQPIPQETTPKKEQRSLEETFTRALPRIFMVILVLGVLWGLKLVSDYGFLSDSVKIIAGFMLSVGLAVCAYWMEKKQKGSRVVALSLYGGAFIVGILVTAAGAIIYDVLSLYVALVLALIYIIYGVFISYLKGNEALTALVVFTSLLLPYLLEYMEFNPMIIGIFIVLLFATVQIVIWKHKQRKALYIGMAFSILALAIVSTFHNEQILFFALAILTLYCVFLVSYLRLYTSKSKRNASMLFTFTIIVLSLINGLLINKDMELLIVLGLMLGALAGALYIAFKRADKLLIDMFATLSVLTLLNIIAQLNISQEVMFLLLVVVSFAGLILAVKHDIIFMKWVKGITFSILAIYVFTFYSVQPFFSMEHVTMVLVIAMLAGLYAMLLQSNREPVENKEWIIGLRDLFPPLLYAAGLLYIWKLDWAYMPMHLTNFLLFSVIAISFAGIVILKQSLIGRLLPFLAGGIYGFVWLILLVNTWVDERAIVVAILVRILYIAVLWAIVADLWKQGIIYKNYEAFIARYTEQLTIAGMIISIIWLFNMTHFMNYHDLINWSTAVILNTVSIFVIASLSLFLAAKRSYRNLKLVGIGLLFFGIIKMIFFDLSELDILIRSISFIAIGAIGLFISNKLLGKDKEG